MEIRWLVLELHWSGINKSLPFKIYAGSYSFDVAESEFDNEIALSPSSVKDKGLNPETAFVRTQ